MGIPRAQGGGHHPPLPPMDTYGVVSISLWWANFFLGSSLTLKVENAFFSALYYSIITTVLWKKGRGQDSYFSTKKWWKNKWLMKSSVRYIHFFCVKIKDDRMSWFDTFWYLQFFFLSSLLLLLPALLRARRFQTWISHGNDTKMCLLHTIISSFTW